MKKRGTDLAQGNFLGRAQRINLRLNLANDSYGHDSASAMTSRIGQVIARKLRFSDSVARDGGDYFVVLLEETDSINAEILRLNVGQTSLPVPAGAIRP